MRIKLSIAAKLMLFVGVLLGGITVAFTWYQYKTSAAEIEERFGLALKHVAATGGIAINGDKHAKIIAAGDEKKTEFQNIKSKLFRIMTANNLMTDTVYTFRIGPDHKLYFAVMLHEKPFVGSAYEIPAANKELFMRVFQGEAVHTPIYADSHGTWISGLAPIKKASGEVVGIFEVDFRVEAYFSVLAERTRKTILIGVVVLIASLLAMLFIALKIARPIKDLRGAALKIIEGDYDVKVTIDTRDEIGELEKVFNRMVKSLSERFLMLKYISPGTARRIERQIHGTTEVEGELRNVTIFFSDVRGFTSFSEKRSPGEVIHTLNEILDVQARIIQEHGGEIDKFVGDEVVAMWSGDRREEKALRASIEIQRILMNTVLKVGIGLAEGEVIFGDIGSADRRDHTMIGANVNLTARICSAAAPGQILVSSHFYYRVQDTNSSLEGIVITPKDAITLKGFSQPVPLYCLRETTEGIKI